MTRKKAIELKCKDCNYDPLDKGTWRQQVAKCTQTDCPLYEHRPMPTVKAESSTVGRKSPNSELCEAFS